MLFKKSTLLSLATLAFSHLNTVYGQAADGGAVAPDNSKVVKLTGKEFPDFVAKNDLFLAEFFAPWCGHCKKLGPEYVKAAETLDEENIPVVQINCDEDKEFCRDLEIPGYPTLKVFKNGHSKDYVGARSADAMVSSMIKQSLPTVAVIDSETDLKEFITDSKTSVIVNAPGASDSALNATFYEVAEDLSDDFTFVSLSKNATTKSTPKLSVYLPSSAENSKPIVFDDVKDDIEKDALIKWIKLQALPLFGDVDGNTFQNYMDTDLPLAYFFYTSEEERAEYTKLFESLGEKYRGQINFAGLNSAQFGRHAENLNMKQQFPLFVIHNITSNLKYGLPQLDEEKFQKLSKPLKLKENDIKKFVENYAKGKIDPTVKSEPVPEVQESNVYKIVATTHDKIINDADKDVLVKYYAPWCGHCKRLAPVYEELADVYASDKTTSKNVVIAEVDATANDIADLDIQGFPTIILYPAGKKSEPVTYKGPRSLESFFEFVHENGNNDADGAALYPEFQKAKEAEEAAEKEAAASKAASAGEEDEDEEDVDHDEL